jgi:hypothetical protein
MRILEIKLTTPKSIPSIERKRERETINKKQDKIKREFINKNRGEENKKSNN